MILLHQIGERKHGSNFNTLEEILNCKEPLSFDGIYESVFNQTEKLVGKDIILFFSGEHLGKDNSFDKGQPLSKFCDLDQILWMQKKLNCRIGYHSYSHRSLIYLSDEEVMKELNSPIPVDYYAYPYGDVDERIARLTKEAGYKEAWSVFQGDGSQFQRKRRYLNW